MRRLVFAFFLTLAACKLPAALEIKDVWTRATIAGTDSAAIFMTITSPRADRLLRASTPAAARTDLMTMQGDSSAMSMAYLDAIDIPANEPVSLDPSGLHVWLAGLNEPLQAGQTFPLTLTFEHAGDQEVMVTIIAPTASPPHADMDM